MDLSVLLTDAGWLTRIAANLVGAADADEVVLDVTLAASSTDAIEDRRSWLAGAVRKKAAMRARTAARRRQHERAAARPEAGVASAAELVERAELQRVLADAVNDLRAEEREVLVLRFFEGLPPRDVATRLSIPIATVRSRTQRGIAHLRERLDRDGGGREKWLGVLAPLVMPAPKAGVVAAVVSALSLAWLKSTGLRVAVAAMLLVAAGWGITAAFGFGSARIAPVPMEFDPVAALLPDADSVAVDEAVARTPVSAAVVVDSTDSAGLVGRVVDFEDGSPIEGAEVCLGGRNWLPRLEREHPLVARRIRVHTDSSGVFALPTPSSLDAPVYVRGTRVGTALRAGYVADCETTEWASDTEPVLRMHRTVPVRFEVEAFDERGQPVPAFTISCSQSWYPVEHASSGRELVASVRLDGKVLRSHSVFEKLARGRDGVCAEEGAAVASKSLHVRIGVAGVGCGEFGEPGLIEGLYQRVDQFTAGETIRLRFDVDLRLPERSAPAIATGRVLEADGGNPVVGARLVMRTGGGWFSAARVTRITQTRADGTFEIAMPKDGSAGDLAVKHPKFQTEVVEIASGGGEVEPVRLTTRGEIVVTVVDAAGEPMPSVPFLFRGLGDLDRQVHERGDTDSKGRARFSRVLEGDYRLFVFDRRFEADENALTSVGITARKGETVERRLMIDVALGVDVVGVVTSPWAVPVVPVFLPLDGANDAGYVRATPRGLGGFTARIFPGRYLVLLGPADDGDRGEVPIVTLAPIEVTLGTRALEFAWPTGAVVGRVELPNPADSDSLRVVVVPTHDIDSVASSFLASSKFTRARGALLASDGQFRFEHVPTGAHRLELRRGGEVLATRLVEVAASPSTHDVGTWQPLGD